LKRLDSNLAIEKRKVVVVEERREKGSKIEKLKGTKKGIRIEMVEIGRKREVDYSLRIVENLRYLLVSSDSSFVEFAIEIERALHLLSLVSHLRKGSTKCRSEDLIRYAIPPITT